MLAYCKNGLSLLQQLFFWQLYKGGNPEEALSASGCGCFIVQLLLLQTIRWPFCTQYQPMVTADTL